MIISDWTDIEATRAKYAYTTSDQHTSDIEIARMIRARKVERIVRDYVVANSGCVVSISQMIEELRSKKFILDRREAGIALCSIKASNPYNISLAGDGREGYVRWTVPPGI